MNISKGQLAILALAVVLSTALCALTPYIVYEANNMPLGVLVIGLAQTGLAGCALRIGFQVCAKHMS
jgi:hypothetical protein